MLNYLVGFMVYISPMLLFSGWFTNELFNQVWLGMGILGTILFISTILEKKGWLKNKSAD